MRIRTHGRFKTMADHIAEFVARADSLAARGEPMTPLRYDLERFIIQHPAMPHQDREDAQDLLAVIGPKRARGDQKARVAKMVERVRA